MYSIVRTAGTTLKCRWHASSGLWHVVSVGYFFTSTPTLYPLRCRLLLPSTCLGMCAFCTFFRFCW